jgi:hypothetical protein
MDVPPVSAAAAAKGDVTPPDVHTVKNVASIELSAAVEKFRPAYLREGSPRVGLLVLGPAQQPFERWRVDVVGLGLLDGQPKVTTLSGKSPLPGLATAGWKEEAAHVLQSTLVDAGVAVVDLPLEQWTATGDELPSDLVFELRWVNSDPLPAAQLRVLDVRTGRVLAVERASVAGAGGDAIGPASQKVLAQGLGTLSQSW